MYKVDTILLCRDGGRLDWETTRVLNRITDADPMIFATKEDALSCFGIIALGIRHHLKVLPWPL